MDKAASPAPPSALRYTRSLHGIDQISRLVGAKQRVLDLGCATGYVASVLAGNGCEVIGVEIDAEAAAVAAKFCKETVVGAIDADETLDRLLSWAPYDVILAADVLEHLSNPARVLRTLPRLLSFDGRLVVSLPNVAFVAMRLRLFFGDFEYRPTGLLDVTHLRFFTLKTARRMLEQEGWRITKVLGQPAVLSGARLGRLPLGKLIVQLVNRVLQDLARYMPSLWGYQLLFVAVAADRAQASAERQ